MKDGIGRGRGFFFLKEFSAYRSSAFAARCLFARAQDSGYKIKERGKICLKHKGQVY